MAPLCAVCGKPDDAVGPDDISLGQLRQCCFLTKDCGAKCPKLFHSVCAGVSAEHGLVFCGQRRMQGGISKVHTSKQYVRQLNTDPAWANVKQYISSGYTFQGLRFKPDCVKEEKRFVRKRTSEVIVGTKGRRNLVRYTFEDGEEEFRFRKALGNLNNQGKILDGRRNNRGRPRGASTAGGDRESKRQRTGDAAPGQVGLLVGGEGVGRRTGTPWAGCTWMMSWMGGTLHTC